jgi:integrase
VPSDNPLRPIQFRDRNKIRQTIRLGRFDRRSAQAARGHVAHLVAAHVGGGALPRATAEWLREVGADLYAKLEAVGLVGPREGAAKVTRLAAFLDSYIAGRTDLKPRTRENLKQTRRVLVEFFGADRDIATINAGEAEDWYRKLKARFAAATVAMHVKKARQAFGYAGRRNLVTANPFRDLKAGSMVNTARQRYVAPAEAVQVIGACPDRHWRLLFALARFAALRVPSESHGLKWADVLWDKGRMLIRSPKTEHHEGRDVRLVPIGPELLPYLRECWEQAASGAVYVLGPLRHTLNPSTTGEKIIRRAGLKPWPKLWQNMRSSCETDWAARVPLHVACAWSGNTQAVALRHYLQVTDEHFSQEASRKAVIVDPLRPQPAGCQIGEGCSGLPEQGNLAGAVIGAAEGSGKNRKSPEPQMQKPAQPAGFAEVNYPQGAANPPAISREKLENAHAALSAALSGLRHSLPAIRQSDIGRLTTEVQAARRRVRRGAGEGGRRAD